MLRDMSILLWLKYSFFKVIFLYENVLVRMLKLCTILLNKLTWKIFQN